MSRFWRFLKLGAFGIGGLLGLGLIWLAVANAQANGKLQEKLDALKAAGEPTSLAELARKPIPPETNAATYLNRAQEGVNAIGKPMSADFGRDEEDFEAGKKGGKAYQAAQEALAANPEVVPLLEQASKCIDYDPQLNFQLATTDFLENEFLPNLSNKRAVTRTLNYQALVNLGEAKPEAAMEQCLALLRLARLFESDPLLVNHLVVLAVRGVGLQTTNLALRAGPLSPALHDALDAELAKFDLTESFRHVMRTDRAYGISSFAELASDPRMGFMKVPSGKKDESDYLELFDTIIADGPRSQPSNAVEKLIATAGPLTRNMAPAFRAVYEANTRTLAFVRALRVLNALARSGQTADPPDLESLKLPEDVLIDPYNLKPLIIKRQDSGWLVYSVGKNGKDDGGRVEKLDDVGFGPK